jgi:beta-mannosidase
VASRPFHLIGTLIPNNSYAFLTKLMQSEGVGNAYVHWRREWRGPGKEYVSMACARGYRLTCNAQNAGTLVWQLNDVWPVSSWAIVDYFVSRLCQSSPKLTP